ncbi:dihydrolipoamide acetyltransferase family protein [Salipiger mucosus]|uniref:Dihydrolipoamide acetyltransferase component of pyruvate dehydrogenase complex n=1 Tax=Salipiger mucosus DSM 16094 TaxID=1123237 RepID=S9S7F7_9RHOB|nr:dihydrolipoamide acetyltransferase family protein [Salipiger mucosus]EPX82149.1 Dihydrolipoamide acetyltransferase component of pyruvate dehydrogenase complex [Salipiger mucosus DSM 16094]
MSVFRMPSLGSDMEDGTLVEWLVHPGDHVSRGDVVAVIETQKGAIEIEVFEDGTVDRIEAALGQKLPVGAPLAVIREDGEPAADERGQTAVPPPEAESPAPAPPPPADETLPTPPAQESTKARPAPDVIPASPAARARAAELGIDLSALTGSGPGGAILLADVSATRPESTPHPAAKPGLDLAAMREAIAAAMSRSKREIPHYYLDHEIDLEAAQAWLSAHNAKAPPEGRLLMAALIVKATARAAAEARDMNGHFTDSSFVPSKTVNAGVAIALRGGGLIAPALMGAEALCLPDLMAAMRDLVARARGGRLRGAEMTEGTITVSSLGEGGVDGLTGVIYPPQVALVGFGAPRRLPRIIGGAVLPRLCLRTTLAADHRVSDGRSGATFLSRIAGLLQTPEAL